VLEAIIAERRQPQAIRCDNGPELTSRHFLAWCVERRIELLHIQSGRSTQNGHVESFTPTRRTSVSGQRRAVELTLVK
jgi:putative transposase